MRALIVFLLLAGCAEDVSYMIVTVDKRASVKTASKLHITLSNSGSMRSDDLELDDAMFPVTFSLSAPGRTGEVTIEIDALDDMDGLVGRGKNSAPLSAETATVLLDGADFVVNNTTANNQFLSNDFEAVGLQLAAISNGTWTAVFRDDCTQCSVYGRRFDPNGVAVSTTLAGSSTNEFKIETTLTTSGTIPAAAAAGLTTLVAWDFFDSGGTTQGVACRSFNEQGTSAGNQTTVSTDTADVVTAVGLSNGNFAVTWQTFTTSQIVKGIILMPNCTPLAAAYPVSNSGTLAAHRSHVASNGANVLYTWIVDGEIRVRPGLNNGTFAAAESVAIAKTGLQEIDHVRVTPWGTGFAIAARWSTISGTGPGKIEVYRTNNLGQVMGKAILITDKSGSDFASNKSFGIARRPDDALLVVWHACETGPGSCEVYGRMLRPTGAQVGSEFVIPTSTGGDQINPSVIALQDSFVASWNDSSGVEPDRSGSAVRARVVFPLYDDARAVLGATCGASAPGAPDCGEGLACAMGSDGVQRCYATCTPPVCPAGGTCTTVDGGVSACVF